jgi:hypothetical protein
MRTRWAARVAQFGRYTETDVFFKFVSFLPSLSKQKWLASLLISERLSATL